MQYSTFGPRYNSSGGNSNNNNTSSATFHPGGGILKKVTSPPPAARNPDTGDQFEARNDDVIRRVAEMKHILQVTAETGHWTFIFWMIFFVFCERLFFYISLISPLTTAHI